MSAPVVIDLQAIEDLRALNPGDHDEFMHEIIAIFLEDTPERITELEAAFAAGDLVKFSRAAHSIKGSSANLGAAALRLVAGQLEERSRGPDVAGLPPLVASLKAEFDRTKAELNRLFPA